MEKKWTDNQTLAIDSRGGSILVSAAAGSGKTACLVERVIKRITDPENPTPIDRILIVTFTKAAAAELKERISKKLTELMGKDPQNSWYRRQLMHLPLAHISTVDSFCSNLVKEFSHEIGINDDYRIADSGELALLKQDAISTALDIMYDSGDPDFYDLIEAFVSKRDDKYIVKTVFKFHDFLCSHPFMDAWLKEKLSYYEDFDSVSRSIWGKVILEFIDSAADYCIGLTESSLKSAEEEPELYSIVSDLLNADLEYLSRLKGAIATGTYNDVVKAAYSFEVGRLLGKSYKDHPIFLKIKSLRDEMKKVITNKIKANLSMSEEDILEDVKALYPLVSQLFSLIKLFDENYTKLKREKNVADFSDVAHWTLNLLVDCKENGEYVPTKYAALVSDRFDEVMVDEYQDANEVQDLIYNSVSHNGQNLFVVGDVKQSIYGFRQAMPEIFLSRKNALPLYNSNLNNYPAKVILEQNFRSRKEVTDYVNYTFRLLMSEELGDLEYNDEEALVPASTYPETDDPCVEFHLVELDSQDEDDSTVAEARYLGKLIFDMCHREEEGKPKLYYKDFAIIMRSANKYADTYVRELKRAGVPAVCTKKEGFIKSDEIMLACNFLKVVDNPLADISLVSVLMSPIYGFTPDDMAKIRSIDRNSSMYVALCDYAEQGDPKSKRFLDDLNYLRSLAVTEPADVFVTTLYEYTNFLAVATSLFGKTSLANLKLLVDYAAKFEQGSSKGLSAFVSYLTRLEREDNDLASAGDLEGATTDCVKVMSIHSSKGLEFPVCILANTHRKFTTDKNDNALLHGKLGFASKLRDRENFCDYPTMPRNAVSHEIVRNEMAEELRVLYVAMTRAKEQLIMVSTGKGIRNYAEKIGSNLVFGSDVPPYYLRSRQYLSDWLMITALLHPAADDLRDFASMERPSTFICKEDEKFKTVIVENGEDLLEDSSREEPKSRPTYKSLPDDVYEIIKSRFEYEYPAGELSSLPQKVTASELAHRDSKNAYSHIFRKPDFLRTKPLSGAERGTAFHLFLEHCDYKQARTSLSAEISRLINEKILTMSQAEAIDIAKVNAFLSSPVVEMALKAQNYIREYKFTVNIPARDVKDDISPRYADTPVVLQGAVDLIIVDEDGIIVVDYKTDRVDNTDILADMYQKQLYLYKIAVEQIFKKPVKKSLIYSIHLSEIKEV